MKYTELLEIHFWDGETYSPAKILGIFDYFKNATAKISVDYLDVNVDLLKIDENIYENFSSKKIKSEEVNGNFKLIELLGKKFITCIKFTNINNENTLFYVQYSGQYIYYSIEFEIEKDNDSETIYFKIKDTYCDLINILKPLVSNAGFEILWEDSCRISNEKHFEGLYGYLSNNFHFPFINMYKSIKLEKGYLFMNIEKI